MPPHRPTANHHRLCFRRFPNGSWCYFVLLCMSVVLGIPGNTITAAAYANIKVKTTCDWYILFVAMLDLVACTFRNTAYIMEYRGVWASSTTSGYCKFVSWVSQITVFASISLFTLIAIDRYMKLCHTNVRPITPLMSRNICLTLTSINVLLATPCFVMFENINIGICQLKESLQNNDVIKAYYSAVFILFLIMMATVTICYMRIAVKVRRLRRIDTVEAPLKDPTVPNGCAGKESSSNMTVEQVRAKNQQSKIIFMVTDRKYGEGTLRPSLEPTSNGGHLPISQTPCSQSPPDASRTHSSRAHLVHSPPAPERGVGVSELRRIQTERQYFRQRRNVRVTWLLFVVTALFIVSWIPPYAAMVKNFYVGYAPPFSVGDIVLIAYAPNVYVVNTFANPVIYAILSSTHRKHVWACLKMARVFLRKTFRCNR
ncbi:hypothetical protein Btru_001485 [Bulinus truncatus]|nr:hypothetical protein Btru_001485 [Bulinus truncatus]